MDPTPLLLIAGVVLIVIGVVLIAWVYLRA